MSAAADSQHGSEDTMPIGVRITILTVVAGLVVSVVRHGLETKWGSWDGYGIFLAWWVVHFMLLRFFVAVTGFVIAICARLFPDLEPVRQMTVQYCLLKITLFAAVAIGAISLAVS